MYKFSEIGIGDMFNTKSARWVRIDVDKAICVLSSIFNVGLIQKFEHDTEVVLLYSSFLRTIDGDDFESNHLA